MGGGAVRTAVAVGRRSQPRARRARGVGSRAGARAAEAQCPPLVGRLRSIRPPLSGAQGGGPPASIAASSSCGPPFSDLPLDKSGLGGCEGRSDRELGRQGGGRPRRCSGATLLPTTTVATWQP